MLSDLVALVFHEVRFLTVWGSVMAVMAGPGSVQGHIRQSP